MASRNCVSGIKGLRFGTMPAMVTNPPQPTNRNFVIAGGIDFIKF